MWNEGGDLDGRGAIPAIPDGEFAHTGIAAASHSGRMDGSEPSGGGERQQVAGAGFLMEFGDEVYVLVGNYRGRVPDHGQPWNGPDDRAEVAGRAKSEGQPARVAGERLHCAVSVHDFSAGRCGAFCICAAHAAAGRGRADGSHPAIVLDTRDADGACGIAAGLDSGGGDVQRERVAEFAGGFERDGPGGATRGFHASRQFLEAFAESDAGVGRGVDRPWAGEMGTRAGGRVDGRFTAVWKFAGAVFAGNV